MFPMSLSARRAWIEMPQIKTSSSGSTTVALRKESVDRNLGDRGVLQHNQCRSPQGERG